MQGCIADVHPMKDFLFVQFWFGNSRPGHARVELEAFLNHGAVIVNDCCKEPIHRQILSIFEPSPSCSKALFQRRLAHKLHPWIVMTVEQTGSGWEARLKVRGFS